MGKEKEGDTGEYMNRFLGSPKRDEEGKIMKR